MIDFLLPNDDRTVLIQLVVVLAFAVVALRVTWRHPDARLFVIGLVLIVLAGMGARALH